MKYIYIAGLEHSGTTLTDYLLSQSPNAIGLGEVSQFFDSSHMHQYMSKWGDCDDVEYCSCMQPWAKCDFWKNILSINGLNSDQSICEKYTMLFDYVRSRFGDQSIIVDSSKSVEAFKNLQPSLKQSSHIAEIKIVFTCKDVRSFTMSILRKSPSVGLLGIVKTFNWWFSINQAWLKYLDTCSYSSTINLYEYLCDAPQRLVNEVIAPVEQSQKTSISHIAMGNKNFALRNKGAIRYDDEWRSNWKIKLVYFFYIKARKLNKYLYQSALNKASNSSK